MYLSKDAINRSKKPDLINMVNKWQNADKYNKVMLKEADRREAELQKRLATLEVEILDRKRGFWSRLFS